VRFRAACKRKGLLAESAKGKKNAKEKEGRGIAQRRRGAEMVKLAEGFLILRGVE